MLSLQQTDSLHRELYQIGARPFENPYNLESPSDTILLLIDFTEGCDIDIQVDHILKLVHGEPVVVRRGRDGRGFGQLQTRRFSR